MTDLEQECFRLMRDIHESNLANREKNRKNFTRISSDLLLEACLEMRTFYSSSTSHPEKSSHYQRRIIVPNQNNVEICFDMEFIYDNITETMKICKIRSFIENDRWGLGTKKSMPDINCSLNNLKDQFITIIHELMIETPPKPPYIPPLPEPELTTNNKKNCIIM